MDRKRWRVGIPKDEGEERETQARCQRIHPSRPPILVLAPPANRASGQSEITLSPSRCVQSKLQFKSSCQTLFPLSLFHSPSPPFLAPFRQPELEIPKIVLHRPPTNSVIPRAHARSIPFLRARVRVHCSSAYVCCDQRADERTNERMNERASERASFRTAGSREQIEELCDWPLRRGRIIGAFRSMTGCSGARELREDESFPDRRPSPLSRRQEAHRNFFDN